MDCDQIRELIEAYVLEALDANERASIEQHLSKCPDCEHLANELADTVHMLPQALAVASSLRPPDSLKSRLLQSLVSPPAATFHTGESKPDDVDEGVGPSAPPSPSADGQSGKIWRDKSFWQWLSLWRRPRAIAILAVIILLVFSLAWAARLSMALAQERALRTELANIVSQQEVVLEVIDSDQTVKRFLRASEAERSSDLPPYGKLYTRSDLRHVVAMAARLPQPPPDQAYHLWLTRQGQTTLAGVMTVNDQGFGLLVFDADDAGPVYEMAQLTLQSEGGTAPAGELILRWEASRS